MTGLGFLLRLYPQCFRCEYGREVEADYKRQRRHASNPAEVAVLWISMAFDTVRNAVAAHLDLLSQDLQYFFRKLRGDPGFAIASVLLTALGVGATTAAFTLTDHVLIRPLPYREPDRLVRLYEDRPSYPQMELSPPNFVDWRARSRSFESFGAFTGMPLNLSGIGEPLRLEGARMSSEVLPMLGIAPLIGRFFTEEEDREGAPLTVMLSYGLWQTAFGGEAGVLGRKVLLNDIPAVVVGVMPADFHFPNREAEFWIPLQLSKGELSDRTNNELYGVARLRKDVTIEQSRQEMRLVAEQLEREHPKENRRTGATVLRMRDQVSPAARLMLSVLLGAALCVLLIACSNLANLLLARALSREKEMAVRASLGAGRERLVRQLVTESLVLAVLGGAGGVLAANVSLPLLMKLVPLTLPIAEPTIDLRLLFFALGLTVLTGLAFGVYPAWRAGTAFTASSLRDGERSGSSAGKERLRSMLVAVEVCLSVVLLIGAGLLIRALGKVESIPPGFRAENVLTMRMALPVPKYENTSRRHQFYQQVLDEVRGLPGVTDAGFTSFLPMTMRGGIWPVGIGRVEVERSGARAASLRYVTAGYFRAMGIPLLHGREVTAADTQKSHFVAVVSASFAEKFFPGVDSIGQRFNFAFDERTIVGVAGNVRVRGLERVSEPQVYLPEQQVKDGWLSSYAPKDLAVRGEGDLPALLPSIRRIVRRADPELPVSAVRLMEDVLVADSAPRRVQMRVLSTFAGVAILLACIGIHGLLSFMVTRRAREIAVRMALGANAGNILRLVLSRSLALALALAGAAAGLALGHAAGRSLQSILVGVDAADAATFSVAVALTVGTTVVGSLLPALKALRVDPAVVMRSE